MSRTFTNPAFRRWHQENPLIRARARRHKPVNTVRSKPISERDQVYQRDRDHLELRALMQAGISTPRARLDQESIEAAVSRFDPSLPIWKAGA